MRAILVAAMLAGCYPSYPDIATAAYRRSAGEPSCRPNVRARPDLGLLFNEVSGCTADPWIFECDEGHQGVHKALGAQPSCEPLVMARAE